MSDFYGTLKRILRVEYAGWPFKRTVLFEVDWYDPSPDHCRVHGEYELVDINPKKKYNKYEPFILATQAKQVVYVEYPGMKKGDNRLAVIPICARSKVEYIEKDESITNSYQLAEVGQTAKRPIVILDEDLHLHEVLYWERR